MAKRHALRLLPATLAVLALLAAGLDGVRTAHAGEEIAVHTIYLTHPVGDVHRITIRGTLGGPGRVQLDTNRCGQNLFGDTTICTTDPVEEVPVRLEQLQVKDIKGDERRVFRVEGKVRPAGFRYYLVVPRGLTGNFRLAIVTAEGRVRVVSLEELMGSRDTSPFVPAHAPGTPERTPPTEPATPSPPDANGVLGRAVYAAVQSQSEVTIRARGEHPRPGHGARLERVPGNAQPPVHRLVIEAPSTDSPQGTAQHVPFSVAASFAASGRIGYVFVLDADGQHRIPVQQAPR